MHQPLLLVQPSPPALQALGLPFLECSSTWGGTLSKPLALSGPPWNQALEQALRPGWLESFAYPIMMFCKFYQAPHRVLAGENLRPRPLQMTAVLPLLTRLLGQYPHYLLRQPNPAGILFSCLPCHSFLGVGSSLAEGLTYCWEGMGSDPDKTSEGKSQWAGANPC